MQLFTLQKHTDNSVIFSGHYASFSDCIEDAVERGEDLSYIDLSHQNLSNANLDGAKMPYAYMAGTNLSGANLSEANLKASVFYNCSLYNTCLAYSDLSNSDFRGAYFGATLIDNANIQNCIFSTLSCFELEFALTRSMDGCIFVSSDGTLHKMSQHPIVIRGYINTHIIIFDSSVKIGMKVFPKNILPKLMSIIGLRAAANDTKGSLLIDTYQDKTKTS